VIGAAAVLVLCGSALSKPDKADSSDPVLPSGTKRVSEWIKDLRTGEDLKTRRTALLVITQFVPPKLPGVIPAVCATMKEDKDVGMRVDAAMALGKFAPPLGSKEATIDVREMVDCLQSVLAGESKDSEERVREAAANSMGKMGMPGDKGLSALIEALKDKARVQTAAATSIDDLATPNPKQDYDGILNADDASEPMLALLKDSSAAVLARCVAARFISKRERVDGRINALTDVLAEEKNDAALRKTAAEMLGGFKEGLAADAVPALAKALADKNADLRIAAGTALSHIAKHDASRRRIVEVLPDIQNALKDDNATVRNSAINTLGNLEESGADALKELMACLKAEKVIENRVAALRAMGLMKAAAKDAVGLISDYANSANPDISKAAKEALKRIEGS